MWQLVGCTNRLEDEEDEEDEEDAEDEEAEDEEGPGTVQPTGFGFPMEGGGSCTMCLYIYIYIWR